MQATEQVDDVIKTVKPLLREAMRLAIACDHPGLSEFKDRLAEVFEKLECCESSTLRPQRTIKAKKVKVTQDEPMGVEDYVKYMCPSRRGVPPR